MRKSLLFLALAVLTVGAIGCGKDADDTASDEASAATAHQTRSPAAAASLYGGPSTATGAKPSGPPTSAPPQMVPGQGMSSVMPRGHAQSTKVLKDQDLPK